MATAPSRRVKPSSLKSRRAKRVSRRQTFARSRKHQGVCDAEHAYLRAVSEFFGTACSYVGREVELFVSSRIVADSKMTPTNPDASDTVSCPWLIRRQAHRPVAR